MAKIFTRKMNLVLNIPIKNGSETYQAAAEEA